MITLDTELLEFDITNTLISIMMGLMKPIW